VSGRGPLVAVTGGSGALGARVIESLLSSGLRVRALIHRAPVAGADETMRGDLLDEPSLRALVEGAAAVVHLAARTHARSPRAYERVNVGGTAALLRAAASGGVRSFVHVSTTAIDRSGGAYSRSKADAEEAVAASGLSATVLRLPDVLGAGGREGLDRIVAAARAGRPVPLVGSGTAEVRPVHVDDVAAVFPRALEVARPGGRVYTLAGESITLRRFAELANEACGGRSRLVEVPVGLLQLASLAARILPLPLYPDQLARLRSPRPAPSPEAWDELGVEPRPLRDALRSLAS
jgi:nucleoside-diphosphate-sugar epimerase